MPISVLAIERIVREPISVAATFDSFYDEEADVLYCTFERGMEDNSVFAPNDVVLRYRDGRLLSVTILHASKRPELDILA
jgi:hypothetical protein